MLALSKELILAFLPKELIVALLSITPFVELRGSIPYGLVAGVSPPTTLLIAIVANIIVIPAMFIVLEFVEAYGHRFPLFKKCVQKYLERLRKQNQQRVKKWGYYALLFFVAVPLPFTGIYSATALAWLFGMQRKKALVVLILGMLLSALSITVLSYAGILIATTLQ